MSRDDHDLDRMLEHELSAWLEDGYVPGSPRNLTAVVERTRGMRQRPAWASLERWLPMAVITARSEVAMPLRMAWLLLIALLVLAIATGALIVGSSLLNATAPIPQGGAALIAFGTLDDGPDGQKAGDIYSVSADGTDLRQLTDGPEWEASPSWSPDGTRIAFRSWSDGTDSVMVMDADGGNRITLGSSEQPSQDCLALANLAWSPDGNSLIFPTRSRCTGPGDRTASWDLMVVATDASSQATPLLTESYDARFATWSPDGTALAFIGKEDMAEYGLYVTDWRPEQTLEGPQRGTRMGPDLGIDIAELDAPPSWAPDGNAVAVATALRWEPPVLGSSSVHVMHVDGSGKDLTIEAAASPVWSPDGSQLAFQRTVDPSEYFDDRPCTVRTWLVDADGTNERPLDALGDGCESTPSWSPDGTRLVMRWIDTDPANVEQNPFYLSVLTVEGSTPLVRLPDSIGASWQPVVP